MSDFAIAAALRRHGLRPTQQRIAIYQYLMQHATHPTADIVYQELKPHLPSCSLMTVYNGLDALVEAGLARVVTVEPSVKRFDGTVEKHGHFRCHCCGTIYDFPLTPENMQISSLWGFQILEQDIYCSGVCPSCAAAT